MYPPRPDPKPPITRLRRRPLPPSCPNSREVKTDRNLTVIHRGLDNSSVRGLRVAFEETPLKLRELEEGWRARRRRGLVEIGRSEEDHSARRAALEYTNRIAKESGRVRRSLSPPVLYRGASQPADHDHLPLDGRLIAGPSGIPLPRAMPACAAPPTPPASPPPFPKIPIRSPPSPPIRSPPSPPTQPKHPDRTSALFQTTSLSRMKPHPSLLARQPRPIKSHPLPPMLLPTAISPKTKSDTLFIPHPESGSEIVISLDSRKQIAHIVEKGWMIILSRPKQGVQERRLRLGDVDGWTSGDRRDWMLVQDLVESFKRKTPRVKLYHALGHLTITCSEPPDIVLSFAISLRDTAPSSDMRGSASLAKEHHPVEPSATRASTKVRILYSRIAAELVLETALTAGQVLVRHSVDPQRSNFERYRSKRVLPLHVGRRNTGHQEVWDGEELDLLRLDTTGNWRDEEKEAVRRLWQLGDEWRRYDL